MRIVRREEFLKLPPGTLYCVGVPWIWSEPLLKHETAGGNDWYRQDFTTVVARDFGELIDRQEAMLENGARYPLDVAIQRDGGFAEDEMFLVYEKRDVEKIQAALDWAWQVAE